MDYFPSICSLRARQRAFQAGGKDYKWDIVLTGGRGFVKDWGRARQSCLVLLLLVLSTGPGFVRAPESDSFVDPFRVETGRSHRAAGAALLNHGSFLENRNQIPDDRIAYYGVAGSIRVGFGVGAFYLVLHGKTLGGLSGDLLLRGTWPGSFAVRPEGHGERAAPTHFFLGSDPARWVTDVRSFEEVTYRNLYPSIDLTFRVVATGLKYDLEVRPGGDPLSVHFAYDGADVVRVDTAGVVLRSGLGDFREDPPIAWQEGRSVPCRFRPRGINGYGFDCASWDRTRSLLIDPLMYGTFLGGAMFEYGYGVAVDANDSAYVTGSSDSWNFPATPGAFDTSDNGNDDVFVTKLDPNGSALVYSTYLGGGAADVGEAIALDAAGNAYVTGYSQSTDFPTTPGAYDTVHSPFGERDAFVAKLNGTGQSLVYSTFLGAHNGQEAAHSIAVDPSGRAVVVGQASNGAFPTTPSAYDTSINGGEDAFITQLNANGSGLVYSTFLGGSGNDIAQTVALDAAGDATVAGSTASLGFPTTAGVYDATLNGASDAFLVRMNETGASLVFATFLGGGGGETAFALDLDGSGNLYAVGMSNSGDFPATLGAFDTTAGGGPDGFITKMDSNATSLVYSTYLGTAAWEQLWALAVGPDGSAYVAGYTTSTVFPVVLGTYDRTFGGVDDWVVARLAPDGSELLYSTYLGGPMTEGAEAIALGSSGVAYVTGSTDSGGGFPTTPGAFDTVPASRDAAVVKLNMTSYRVTVDTVPAGLQVLVAGNPRTAPYSFWCAPDNPVALDAPSPQVVTPDWRYAFANWSDAGNQSHGITCATTATYTARFTSQYRITLDTNPTNHPIQADLLDYTSPSTFWWDDGSVHALAAPQYVSLGPWSRLNWTSWSDGGGIAHPLLVTAPLSLVAFYGGTEYLVTVGTDPPGLGLEVDGRPYNGTTGFWWGWNSSHSLNASTPQGGFPWDYYAFRSWSDGITSLSRGYSVTRPDNLTAGFAPTFGIGVRTSPPGLTYSVDGVASNSTAVLAWEAGVVHWLNTTSPQTDVNGTTWVFSAWSDGAAMNHSVVPVGPGNYTASFDPAVSIVVDTVPSGLLVEWDSVLRTAPFTVWCPLGSAHAVNAPTPQNVSPDSQWVHRSWSDGGAPSHVYP